jgi:exopolysaccharide biosynthesis polyprenyl glycosylphosphotransferase
MVNVLRSGRLLGDSGLAPTAAAMAGLELELELVAADRCANRTAATHPRWLQACATWHQAERHAAAIALDAIVALLVAAAVTGSIELASKTAAAFVVLGLVFGVWKRRTTLETQGVGWYARHLGPALLAAGACVRALSTYPPDRAIATALVGVFVALCSVRAVLWQALGAARRRGQGLQPTLVIGPPERCEQIAERMRVFPEAGLQFESAYEPGPYDGTTPDSGRELVEKLLGSADIAHVICVADEDDGDEAVYRDLVRFSGGRVDVSVLLPIPRMFARVVEPHLGDLKLAPIRLKSSWGTKAVKRLVDVTGSALLIVLSSPVLAATALAVRLTSPGPVIFKQERVGYGGGTFTIYKFRSMVQGAEAHQAEYLPRNVHRSLLFKVEGDPRITPVGNLIRRFSIDELPQLFNVLKGEMSLVGPRPLAVGADDFDTAAQIRHEVLPGITGLWQVNGGNALPYEDMVDMDLAYVTNHTLGLDLMLMARTIPALLVRRGAY